ncbi:MAG: hypothetical protein JSW50_11325, partial [Candidatus Latescibacterota bacterium]
MIRIRSVWHIVFAAVLVVVSAPVVNAVDKEDGGETLRVEEWLLLGPAAIPLPAFNDEGDSKIGGKELLGYEHAVVAALTPDVRSAVHLAGGSKLTWRHAGADTLGVAIPVGEGHPALAYLAAYIDVPRWMKIDLEARSTQAFEIY